MNLSKNSFPNLHVMDHPLIADKLTRLREKSCPSAQFKQLLHEIALLMGGEVWKHLKTESVTIDTPLEAMEGQRLAHPPAVVVPILRAGLGMSDALTELYPEAITGHIGLYRDAETKRPVEYMVKLPKDEGNLYVVVDPMLATGHSAVYAVDLLIKRGISPQRIVFMGLVAAPEGVTEFHKSHPDIPVYVAALDRELNDHAYILPGLGDAGDRLFNTEHD